MLKLHYSQTMSLLAILSIKNCIVNVYNDRWIVKLINHIFILNILSIWVSQLIQQIELLELYLSFSSSS